MSDLFFDMNPGGEVPEGQVKAGGYQNDDLGRAQARSAEERRKRMAPPGALGLPILLDERRLQYGIVDAVFERAPLYDRVVLYQYDPFMDEEGRLKGSPLIIPDASQDREKKSASSGILCGCGPAALDTLASNGVQLGDRVEFIRMTPWSIRVDYFASQWEWVIVMRVGDLVTSIDLQERLRGGETKLQYTKNGQHQITDADGRIWRPQSPDYIAGEY